MHPAEVVPAGQGTPAGTALPVTEAVAEVLTRLGADTVFGVVGSGNFKVTNALIARGARYVAARHEGGAAVMADAWARLTGRPGVLSVHQGPGLTNAMTGITEAAKSRTPLVVLAADVASSAVRSNFRIDVAALATSVGATAFRLHSPAFAVDETVRAYRTAVTERRTVVLALPLDVQAGACTMPAIDPVLPGRPLPRRPRLSARSPTRWPGPAGRCSLPGGGRAWPAPALIWSGLPTGAARCWPPRRRPRACSAAARGTWT